MIFKNQMVKTIVGLQKNGIRIHLTDEGYTEFLKLVQEEFREDAEMTDKVG